MYPPFVKKLTRKCRRSRSGLPPTATTKAKSNGISTSKRARNLQRPEFDRLQKDIFAGQVNTVIVWKLDRLSRRLRDGVNVLADWCERGLKIIVLTQQIELNGAVGRMIAAVMLGLAEIELEYRQERQAAGIEVAKRKGVYMGRKRGTTKGKPNRVRELACKGLRAKEIAQAIGTSVRTVQRYLLSQKEQ